MQPWSAQFCPTRCKEGIMDDTLVVFLFLGVGAVCLFSFLAVASWTDARRREREAYYRSEAIKKLSEIQGTVSEPVLQLIREALTPVPDRAKASQIMWDPKGYRREREAYYRNEMLTKFASMPS